MVRDIIPKGFEKMLLGECEAGRFIDFYSGSFLYNYSLSNKFWFTGYCFIKIINIIHAYHGKIGKYKK